MDGDERRAAVAIRDRRPLAERDEDVAVARHDHAIAARFENAFQAL
jgi:hypothetical protein